MDGMRTIGGLYLRWVRPITPVARIVIGLYFGNEAVRKISQGWLVSGTGMIHTVRAYPAAHSGGFYHSFVTGILLPHARLFALLVTLGECVVAVSLILGLFTRIGVLTALWLNLNFLLLKGPTNPSAMIDWAFLLTNTLILLTAAGHGWSLDRRFRGTFSRVPLAGWFAGDGGLAREAAALSHQA